MNTVVYDQTQPNLPQYHNPGAYQYPAVYQQPEPHLPQGDSQVPSPRKHTGNLIVISTKNGKPTLSLGPGCNHYLDILPLIWLILEILVFIWNNSVDVSKSYDNEQNRLNYSVDCLILIAITYLLVLTLHNPGYIRSVETDKIHEAMQNPR